MKVQKIKIVNFRNHSATELELKKVNLFLGPNASGKSSVVDALSFCLTGVNARTSKSGAGLDEVITFGEARAIVSVDMDGVGTVTRTIPHTLQIGKAEGTMTAQQTAFYQHFGVTEDGVLCSIYSSYFLNLEPNEQKNFMFSLMGIHLTDEFVREEFKSWCSATSIEGWQQLWDFLVDNTIQFDGTVERFDDSFVELATLRKNIKKELKTLEAQAAPVKTRLPEGVTVDHRDYIVNKLVDLKKEKDVLLVQLGNGRMQEKMRIGIDKELEREKTLKVPTKSREIIETQITQYRKDILEIQKEAAKNDANIRLYKETLDKLTKFDGKCTMSSLIKCTMCDTDIGELITKFTEKMKKETDERETIQKKHEEIKKIGEQLAKDLEERTMYDLGIVEIKKAKERLEKMTKDGILNVKEIEKKLADIDPRVTKGQTLLAQVDAEILAIKSATSAKTKFDHLTNRLKIVEILVEAFGPKGLKSSVLNRVMKPIEKIANERMRLLTNSRYEINFRIDEDDFNIYILSNGIERRVKHLSTSERLRVGIIMQDVINEITKTKILVVDDAEILDDENRRLFWKLINDIKPNYDTIFVVATAIESSAKSTDDMAVFKLGRKPSEYF